MTHHAKVISGGKIVIPAALRRQHGIKDGDSVVFERDANGNMVLKTYGQIVRDIQAQFRKGIGPYEGSLVDKLIADRRAEAAREDAQIEEYRRSQEG